MLFDNCKHEEEKRDMTKGGSTKYPQSSNYYKYMLFFLDIYKMLEKTCFIFFPVQNSALLTVGQSLKSRENNNIFDSNKTIS